MAMQTTGLPDLDGLCARLLTAAGRAGELSSRAAGRLVLLFRGMAGIAQPFWTRLLRTERPPSHPPLHPVRLVEVCVSILSAVALSALLLDPLFYSWTVLLDDEITQFFLDHQYVGKGGWMMGTAALIAVAGLGLAAGFQDRRLTASCRAWSVAATFVLLAIASAGLLAAALKGLIGRARPMMFGEEGLFGFQPLTTDFFYGSFPSGDATNAFALAIALSVMVPRIRGIAIIFAVWVALGRVAAERHYITDVIAGAVLATMVVLAMRAWWSKRRLVFRRTARHDYALRCPRLLRLLPLRLVGRTQELRRPLLPPPSVTVADWLHRRFAAPSASRLKPDAPGRERGVS